MLQTNATHIVTSTSTSSRLSMSLSLICRSCLPRSLLPVLHRCPAVLLSCCLRLHAVLHTLPPCWQIQSHLRACIRRSPPSPVTPPARSPKTPSSSVFVPVLFLSISSFLGVFDPRTLKPPVRPFFFFVWGNVGSSSVGNFDLGDLLTIIVIMTDQRPDVLVGQHRGECIDLSEVRERECDGRA